MPSEPWFDANAYAWIPGTMYGVMGGIFGSLIGVLAPMGKGKRVVYGLWAFFVAAAALFLILSVTAYFMGQPYGIWYGLGLPGVIGLVLFPSLWGVIRVAYREAEQRKMRAADL